MKIGPAVSEDFGYKYRDMRILFIRYKLWKQLPFLN